MPTKQELLAENQRLSEEIKQHEAQLAQRGDDVEQLESQLQQLDQEIQEQEETIAELQREKESLQLELKTALERLFGSRSEKFIEDPRQLKLELGLDDEQVDDAVEGLITAKEEAGLSSPQPRSRRKRKKKNDKLPEHLPRQIVDVDLPEEEKENLVHIGYDAVETLRISRPELSVLEKRFHKYVAKGVPEAGVRSPTRPPGLVEGNKYDTSIAAEIIANRLGYHLPFYRQQDLFAGSGWVPSRSTLLNVQTAAANLVFPLVRFFADQVRQDPVVATDDTGVKLLLPKILPEVDASDPKSQRAHDVFAEAVQQGKKHVNAKMWAYRGETIPLNVFDFTVSRHRDGPDLFFIDANYSGTLLGDCYGANTGIEMRSSGDILHAACNVHARRHVREALSNHSRHAKAILLMYRQLFVIERRARNMTPDQRLQLRQSESKPIWDRIRIYLDEQTDDVLPKETMGKAIGYLNRQWSALTRYLDDPLIPIDNNETEQLMRQIAVGRKNWIFVGSLQAGYRTADLMTLVSSAIRNDLDVWSYLKGVLDALLAGQQDFEALLPHRWAESHPDQIRQYRQEERADRAEAKERRRIKRRAAS